MKDSTRIKIEVKDLNDDGVDILRNMYQGFITRGRDAGMDITSGELLIDMAYDRDGLKKRGNAEFHLDYEQEEIARVFEKVLWPFYQIASFDGIPHGFEIIEIHVTTIGSIPF